MSKLKRVKHKTKHYVDADGNYLGGYGDGAKPPAEAVECEQPPHGQMRKAGNDWVESDDLIAQKAERQTLRRQGKILLDESKTVDERLTAAAKLFRHIIRELNEEDEN